MSLRLGGWQRLWIFVTVVFGFCVLGFAWSNWPSADEVPHEYRLYMHLPSELRREVLNSKVSQKNEEAFVHDARNVPEAKLVAMPNGHILVFRKSAPKEMQEAAARAYWDAVESIAQENRRVYFLKVLIWWLLPMSVIYLLGLSMRWIYRGFNQR